MDAAPLMYALVAPMVSTMAAAAAMAGPAAPTARLSRPASGTSVAARGPSTLIVATARPRYSTVVTARAMATARGSCRAGSAKRVVSGATASQPTKENISVAAALPRESQPCGANGVQLLARAAAADPATATTTTPVSRLTRIDLRGGAGPQPAGGEADDGQQQRGRDRRAGQLAAAGQLGDVAGPDQADDRRTADHAGQEHPAGRPARRASPGSC